MTPADLPPDALADIADDVHARFGDCPSGAASLADWLGITYLRHAGPEDVITTEVFDQPVRVPGVSLVLAATYRSGSTAIADALVDAGGLGWPVEYFQTGAAHRRFARFDGDDYIGAVLSRRTDETGVFGVKLFPADVRDHAQVWPRLPAPVVVRVRRRDRVGQAVSAWRALNGGPWRATADDPVAAPPPYDFGRLRQLVGLFEWEDRWWDTFLTGGEQTVWFEDLAADYDRTILELLRGLAESGLSPGTASGTRRLRRQADADSEHMRMRFLADYWSGKGS